MLTPFHMMKNMKLPGIRTESCSFTADDVEGERERERER